MLMTAMEREQKLEGGAVAIGVEVGVGDFAEVVPVARAGLLAPADTSFFTFCAFRLFRLLARSPAIKHD
jgi:hypothetical protein